MKTRVKFLRSSQLTLTSFQLRSSKMNRPAILSASDLSWSGLCPVTFCSWLRFAFWDEDEWDQQLLAASKPTASSCRTFFLFPHLSEERRPPSGFQWHTVKYYREALCLTRLSLHLFLNLSLFSVSLSLHHCLTVIHPSRWIARSYRLSACLCLCVSHPERSVFFVLEEGVGCSFLRHADPGQAHFLSDRNTQEKQHRQHITHTTEGERRSLWTRRLTVNHRFSIV